MSSLFRQCFAGAPRAGQRPEIVAGAVLYLKLSGPALYCYAISECLKRYLLAQVLLCLRFMCNIIRARLRPQ